MSERVQSSAVEVLEGRGARSPLGRMMPFLGPAFVAAVAYVDPGNFATNIQAGAQYGYLLLWVILAANLMAMLIQVLSAKLGIATGKSLPEHCRERLPRPVNLMMWIIAELVAMATDLAEFLGAALGFYLLFNIPLFPAAILTAIATFATLGLQRYGFRPLEAVISAMVGVIAACYVAELAFGAPDWGAAGRSVLEPRFDGAESVLLATGILGATVMPHVIYLHSALTQHRIVTRDPVQMRRLLRFEIADVVIAMIIAGFVNAAMLITAASAFHFTGLSEVATIEDAYKTLEPLLGSAASTIFAISLLVSGLSSSAVGTLAGQTIMQGFLGRTVPLWLRRSITMAPALIIIGIGLDPTRTLVISQVILSFGIPFALIPLVFFTRNRALMGPLVNRRFTTLLAAVIASVIVSLNGFLLYRTFL